MSNIFYVVSKGENADDAFSKAVNNARKEHVNDVGVSGSIAEKDEYIIFEGSVSYDPEAMKEKAVQIMSNNVLLKDAYGPAGCISLGEKEYLFFGTSFSND